MRSFSNREILLGVTGSIAAYKAAEIASRLVEYGAGVTPALTASARQLIAPATFEAIAGRRAMGEMFEPLADPEIEHIAVARRAHLVLIAPATANILAKAAHGIADDWLSTTLLATRAPILFAPAMNADMYAHPATQANIAILRGRGCRFVGPEPGRRAWGASGLGRMADPATVIEAAAPLADPRKDFAGRRVLITSGGNYEPIDPVRFIGNRSSGKMGRALALEALARGAQVVVVTGPAQAPLPYGVEVVRVETAREMADAVLSRAHDADIVIGAAAVADYRVDKPFAGKHKRDGRGLTLEIVENPDIIGEIAQSRRPGQIVVGFAAETDDLLENAQRKLAKKGLDLIIATQVGEPDSGFGTDTLKTILLARDAAREELPLLGKGELAERILDRIAMRLSTGR